VSGAAQSGSFSPLAGQRNRQKKPSVESLQIELPPLRFQNIRILEPPTDGPEILAETTRESRTMKLKIGDPAPQFTAISTDGSPIKLSDYFGRKLVLYFYPMDDTPGCTKQACSLRDHNRDIQAKDAAILGVSTQDAASHQRFTEKYHLSFPLVADTDGTVSRAYGAMGSGGLMGTAMSLFGVANRITFIIDESGHIAHIIDKPDCANHAEEVLKLL